jgi:hypothetical protein
MCLVIRPSLLKFFLGYNQFLFYLLNLKMNVYTFSYCTKQLKSRSSSYELTFLTWGHSSL